MKLKVKDVFIAGVISTVLFPVVLISVLLFTGAIHFDVGVDDSSAKKLNDYLERLGPEQQDADDMQLPVYKANQAKADELEEQRSFIEAEKKRLEELKLENLDIKKSIESTRNAIEKLVSKDNELNQQKLEALAQMYAAMKPIEAAPILMNLPDSSIAELLEKIPETRSKGKLMAALGAMDEVRAAKISKKMGISPKK